MNITEYLKVRDLTYLEYCDYLQEKYGIGLANYMTKNWNPAPKCKRTKDGLIAHHKMEHLGVLLANPDIAKLYPFEYQLKENIVYCDYLEHLLLHIKIVVYNEADNLVGIGGIKLIASELNDVYSGWTTEQEWRRNCHNRIAHDKSVYIKMISDNAKTVSNKHPNELQDLLCSFNARFGLWSNAANKKIYEELAAVI